MNCLWNYIGIKGCGSEEPESGMFINQLPGLTIERIDKVAEKEKINFVTVWKDVRQRAWLRLEKDLRRQMRTRYNLKVVKNYNYLKPVLDKDTLIAADEKYRGFVIDLGMQPGSFLTIQIERICITLQEAVQELRIKLFDSKGELIDSIKVDDPQAGKSTIYVNKKYSTSFLFIALDASEKALYTSAIEEEIINKCCEEICCACDNDECDPSIYGAESFIDEPGEITTTNNFFGFEAGYSILCDYSSVICYNKPEFTDVWMFCLGTELMLENIYSTRLNRYTTIDKESSAELKDFYTKEYEDALSESVKALDINSEDCCIVCKSSTQYREVLP